MRNCLRKARWACIGGNVTCCHALCLAHGNDIITGEDIVDVSFNMSGGLLKTSNKRSNADCQLACSSPEINGVNYSDEHEHESDVLAPFAIEDFSIFEEGPPLHSRKDLIPIYDVVNTVYAHYLWNFHYNVMRRGNRYSDIRANAMLQHIVTTSRSPSVSLPYPEGQLFPRIFWSSVHDSVVGAIPSFMLHTSGKAIASLASLGEHTNVRIRDGDILTCRENGN